MADADVLQNGPDEQRSPSPDAPPTDPVARTGEPPGEPPGYDTSKEDYAGISSGALHTIQGLHDARDFAEMIVDTIREGLLVLDFDHRVVAANESFYDQFEVRTEETVGRLVYDLGDGQWDIPELRELLEDILPHEETLNDYEVDHDFEGLGRRVMLLNARRLNDHQLILLAVEDVTQRREGERALRQSESRFRSAFEIATVGVIFWDADMRIRETNGAFLRMTGFEREEALGLTWQELTPEAFHPVYERALAELAERGEATPYEKEYFRKDGSRWWGLFAPRRLSEEEAVEFVLDVTERKEAEEALRQFTETLEERVEERTRQVRRHEGRIRALSRALALAEQGERRRIAHLLHDDLQQVLFGAQMAASAGDAERLGGLLDEALTLTRSLSHELSPPFLEGEDVEDLLRWLAGRKREQHGLEVDVEVRGDVPVPEPALRVLLFQIVRELLFNVVKHAGTNWARLVAERVDGHVRVVVEDEGAGFDPATLEADGSPGETMGLGLPSVRERVELVGGRLDVASAPGRGTRVTVTIPVG